MTHYDLISASPSRRHYEVFTARHELRRRYGVPVNWFAYPSGHYNASVITALKGAGFTGSMTVNPGWASPSQDPFRLPRVRVNGGTSPSALLQEISAAESAASSPSTYGGAGST
jgi:peptidoglycan/xylan/chitin deacetylase (PgdA/CDA1 family)